MDIRQPQTCREERKVCGAPFNPNKDPNMGNEAPNICNPQPYPNKICETHRHR